jgi:hypothetical protein
MTAQSGPIIEPITDEGLEQVRRWDRENSHPIEVLANVGALIARLDTTESLHQCPATVEMMGRTYRCERFRGHQPEMHYSLMGRLDMVQWPEGWQG